MKIVIVCSRLCYGGAERVAVKWADGFVERGDDVILASNLNEEITYSPNEQVKIYNLFDENTTGIGKWLAASKRLRLLVKEHKPDVVIGVMSSCSFIARFATIGMSTKVIATEHNSFERPDSAPMPKVNRFMKFFVNRFYDAITVLTEADRQLIVNRFQHVFTLPNPLAIQPVDCIPEKKKYILAAGRLDDWHYKGFDVLIKAWSLTSTLTRKEGEMPYLQPVSNKNGKTNGWRLQIAGTGSEESLAYLKQLCKENGVEESVDFLGYRTDIQELFKQADIFVLSSRYEGFGLVLIEAMSQGCACVACDYKGRQQEIMSPTPTLPRREGESSVEILDCGILCEPDNVEALAGAMKKMIEDESYRESVRPYAIRRSMDYSIEHIMDKWEELLGKVVR